MSVKNPVIAVRDEKGINFVDGPESYENREIPRDDRTNCRSLKFSPAGKYVSWLSQTGINLVKCSDWSTACIINKVKVLEISFSPLDTYLLTWEPFVINQANPKGSPNLHIYRTVDGSLVRTFICKNQIGWQPQWSGDEKIFSRKNGTDVEFYENSDFERHTHKLTGAKVASFGLSGNSSAPYHVATFSLGSGGQPAYCRLYEYPKFDSVLASKSFFQGDRVDFHWNSRGTSLILVSSVDVDKTGGSYYGKQSLYFMDNKDNTQTLQFSKEGPVYAICWSPAVGVSEFCAIYGHMPAKATLFNSRCQPVYEFGTGPKNAIYFSPDGSRLLLGGFGNLSQGAVDVWRIGSGNVFSGERAVARTATINIPDTTYLQWDPRSETFLTATTTPRMRVDNGWKIWHYTGALLHKRHCRELYEIAWQTGSFSPSLLATSAPGDAHIFSQQPVKPQIYRPPGARGLTSNFKLHDDDEAPHKPGQGPNDAPPSKAALKQRKKREAKKARKADDQIEGDGYESPTSDTNKTPTRTINTESAFVSTGDPEKDKKIKNLNKKLADIAKLKEKKTSGVVLELNQKAKIESEKSLLAELAKLKL